MTKNYFLGLAANYSREDRRAQLFSIGRKEDLKDLKSYLNRKYGGERAILTKNGRSALTLALKAYFKKGDKIIVNGFTCYAVYEAIKAADLVPVFIDINLDDLNFDLAALTKVLESNAPKISDAKTNQSEKDSTQNGESKPANQKTRDPKIKGIIIQNTFGNPVDIVAIEKLAEEYDLTIIEDLAHCAGVKYDDGREAGTVGAATALSFGKDKSIDTISGGAVIFRHPYSVPIKAPSKSPKISDHLRARLYPSFGHLVRVLMRVHLGGGFMRLLVKLHFVERSADNKLDLDRKISKFEAKRALLQIKSLSKSGEKPIREFYFVDERKTVLDKLKRAGFYFEGFWYEKPVSPERYYKKVHFPEETCQNAVYASKHIINLPTIYRKKDLNPARKIITEYIDE